MVRSTPLMVIRGIPKKNHDSPASSMVKPSLSMVQTQHFSFRGSPSAATAVRIKRGEIEMEPDAQAMPPKGIPEKAGGDLMDI